jgi:hypothetical protein
MVTIYNEKFNLYYYEDLEQKSTEADISVALKILEEVAKSDGGYRSFNNWPPEWLCGRST